ncbi:anthranilate phosphoribosyltransferase protein [Marine Group I thaumarchaeote SCGC AAA799-E16]|uniref:Anthranilate phosphoribosyltransferase protein n=1 Tax=Marine Group I thaumarchaeote SCGC AAA799-E16 TaxID=1502292 RepID=A0A081S503_9ARCH|nr:anthranilate phosphoribosyltransferase protein [Marine Group I thaumarchaeote SCGC AAA799-E16]
MTEAFVLIVCESGKEDSLISNLRHVSSVSNAFGTFGVYDLIVKLDSADHHSIQNTISEEIHPIPFVRSTLTLLVEDKGGFVKIHESEQKILDEHLAQAYITIHCPKSQKEDIMDSLKSIATVTEAYAIIGNYEIICKIAAPTYNDISDIISNKIRKISGIQSTITSNIINNQGFEM